MILDVRHLLLLFCKNQCGNCCDWYDVEESFCLFVCLFFQNYTVLAASKLFVYCHTLLCGWDIYMIVPTFFICVLQNVPLYVSYYKMSADVGPLNLNLFTGSGSRAQLLVSDMLAVTENGWDIWSVKMISPTYQGLRILCLVLQCAPSLRDSHTMGYDGSRSAFSASSVTSNVYILPLWGKLE